MNTSLTRSMLVVALATLVAFSAAAPAHAAPVRVAPLAKWEWPGSGGKEKDGDQDKRLEIVPEVKFKASGRLSKTGAKIHVYALVTAFGKTAKISLLDMGLAKKGKSIEAKRKVGKLSVALKISWAGGRSIEIKGTARYLKFKIPMPKIVVRV